MFELRKDPVTGWWVAVVVDREYDRSRFAQRAEPVGSGDGVCLNCTQPPGDGVRVRMLKPHAFSVVGTQREAHDAGHEERAPGLGLIGEVGSWQTIAAPVGHHE